MRRDISTLIEQMTLEEKAGLCSGLNFWHTKAVERLGIPSIMVTDGPHGLRKQDGNSDHLGLLNSVPATCFPSAAGMACSWDRDLIYQVGVALGEECQAENVGVLLGPGVNLKRSPLCGRNFEYFSEDPYLTSEMATQHILGVQSQGVGTSLKHFAVNNQEHRRMSVNAVVDERTMREIYLTCFETPVKKGKPWTVMCAYNQVNGEFASQNEYLLTDILKKEWGHDGFVVSDWGAVVDRVKGLAAGLELEMPSTNGYSDRKIVQAVQNGELAEEVLNDAVGRLLDVIFRAVDNAKPNATVDLEAHHRLAMEVAQESMVLLKNEGGILPLPTERKIALIGAFAQNPRYQGGGSSHINPTKLDNVYEEMCKVAGMGDVQITYAPGYSLEHDDIDDAAVQQAMNEAAAADVAVVLAGLPDRYESEGYDRKHLRIPANQQQLIEAIAEVQPNIVVVLMNGSAIEMPWIQSVKAVLEGHLGGQALGSAIANLLFGRVNPSGKLAETFPMKLAHNPSYLNFPGEGDTVEYKEGLFVGYRYYDTKQIAPLFPFGYGLSYTTFEYTNLTVNHTALTDQDTVTVQVHVKNTGTMAGKEIIQLYVRDVESKVIRPEKELKGFVKVDLQPGEEKVVSFSLDRRAFAYYNVELKDWHVETGDFDILIGKSSRQIELEQRIHIESTVQVQRIFTRNSTFGDILRDPYGAQIAEPLLRKFREQSGLGDGLEQDAPEMMLAMMNDMPIRSLLAFAQGAFTDEMLEGLLMQLNASRVHAS
ncbi:glycoside hydrolase family 3 C-terminal domain-containing protein [Paenibacillus guangzhouensis]|uniref:glycoside hydrolase family 3 C-terminal domain-containing protein n=1 Tax=Paenibacillus guangzhouensis TaxID=1473112 RepID=UPI001266D58F|nr:glycoside hydrolase family 3 C-terminal domain-containing protein [Paenibacillus guangzhouensis]